MKKSKYAYSLGSVFRLIFFSKRISLFIILAAFCCCTPKISPLAATEAEPVKTVPDKLTLGHTLYMNKCGTCHNLKDPHSQSEEGWRKIVPPMAKKAKLTADQEILILHYVLTMREAKK